MQLPRARRSSLRPFNEAEREDQGLLAEQGLPSSISTSRILSRISESTGGDAEPIAQRTHAGDVDNTPSYVPIPEASPPVNASTGEHQGLAEAGEPIPESDHALAARHEASAARKTSDRPSSVSEPGESQVAQVSPLRQSAVPPAEDVAASDGEYQPPGALRGAEEHHFDAPGEANEVVREPEGVDAVQPAEADEAPRTVSQTPVGSGSNLKPHDADHALLDSEQRTRAEETSSIEQLVSPSMVAGSCEETDSSQALVVDRRVDEAGLQQAGRPENIGAPARPAVKQTEAVSATPRTNLVTSHRSLIPPKAAPQALHAAGKKAPEVQFMPLL